MENNISSGNLLSSGPNYGGLDLQGSMRANHNQHPQSLQQPHHCQTQQVLMPHFPLTMGQNHESNKPNCIVDNHKIEKVNNLVNDDEDNSFNEEGMESKGKKVPWQRVKWADSMVRLLITAVSYLGEDAIFGRRKLSALHKKGKWKLASKVMGERGFYVSPQQCEDKFNDLNKRYKKLNDILGRGTSCQVVEKPALLDMMDHLTDKLKDEVRKILSSKQLFYEEMCSYHNNNRLHLPADPALQRSIQMALRSRDDHENDTRRNLHDEADDDDHDHDSDSDYEEYEENMNLSKRMKLGEINFGDAHPCTDFNKRMESQSRINDVNLVIPEGERGSSSQKSWFEARSLELEEKRVEIESEMLELEKQRFKWERFSKKKDQELEQLKMENERMKLENDCKALELKRMEMTINSSK